MHTHDLTYGQNTAELSFTGGQVHTVNARNDIVEAVVIGGGRILAVGSTADIRALAGLSTREMALRGRSLLPGFIDAHCHLTGLGMAMVSIDCKAPGMPSIEALQKAVYERAASQPPGRGFAGAAMTRHACMRDAIRLVMIGMWCHASIRNAMDCGKIVRHGLVGYQPIGRLMVRQPLLEETPCSVQQSSLNRR
jgi:hypothetical protein